MVAERMPLRPERWVSGGDVKVEEDRKIRSRLDDTNTTTATPFRPTSRDSNGDVIVEDGEEDMMCSICLETVDKENRCPVKLKCGHRFHLDCIGSAFNAKGSMQCPYCRKTEKGNWKFGNGSKNNPQFELDERIHVEETYTSQFLRAYLHFWSGRTIYSSITWEILARVHRWNFRADRPLILHNYYIDGGGLLSQQLHSFITYVPFTYSRSFEESLSPFQFGSL